MISRGATTTRLRRLLTSLVTTIFLFVLASCGGGGGGGNNDSEAVTVTGAVTDGNTKAVANASCRFVDSSGATLATDDCDQNGNYQLKVPSGETGFIYCGPKSMPSLNLSTAVTTVGVAAGETLEGEEITPTTTVAADIIRYESPADADSRKRELMRQAETDPNLQLVAAMAGRLFRAMLAHNVNTTFGADGNDGGDGGGASDSDVGGASGDAGDGADFSPLQQATCEFVVGDSLAGGEPVTSAALADFIADGLLDRPDLAAVAAEVNQDADPADVKSAFAEFFPDGLGQPITTSTDDGGQFTLPVPPNMAGYIRCFPKDREQLLVGRYFPGRGADEVVDGQAVNPAATVFSTDIAPVLMGDLATVLENYQADIQGLQVLLSGPNLPEGPLDAISLGTETLPANSEAGLVAFAVTALFNAFNKNGLDVDLQAAIAQLRDTGGVTPAFMTDLGIPADQSQELADLINTAITAAAGTLGTDLLTAWSTGRINVTVMDDVDGSLISDAAVGITNTDLPCTGCESQTDGQGQLTLAIGRLGPKPTAIEVEVSGVPGFESTTATTELVGFATVDLEIRLTDPGRDAQAPTVTITSPADAYITTSTYNLDIQGTAADNASIASVSWSNDRGGSGVCEGTDNWSASGIVLQEGVNVITVTAVDAAENQGEAVLTVTYTPSDTTLPQVTITSPPSGSTYSTNASSLNMSGSASDEESGITQVSWSNDRGGSGVCEGTESWSASNIALSVGTNQITVTALDAAGNEGSDTLTVIYSLPDNSPPSITITSPTSNSTYSTNTASLNIGGTASDDVEVTSVSWSNDRGGSGVCEGTESWSASGITLQEGENVITVTATDGTENATTATLTVTYEPLYRLTVRGSGSGSGLIFDQALEIDCTIEAGDASGTCTGRFPGGTSVSLGFEPLGSSVLTAWSNPCSGTENCTFTLTRNQTVTATILRTCGENEVSIDPVSAAFPEGGGTGSFNVTAPSDCAWTAIEDESWITLTNASGSGDGTVTYRVAPNTGTTSNAGFISVSGHGHSVSQTWSDFIADWNAADAQEGEIYRVLIVDNGNSGVNVTTYYICDGGPYCELPLQSINDPGDGPISFTYDLGPGSSETVTLTLQGPTALHALHEIRYTVGSGTVEYEYNSDLVPD